MSHDRAATCPKKTISSEAWIESFPHSPYGISPQVQATVIKSAVGIGLAYIARNETIINNIKQNIYFFFGGLKDFKQARDNEWYLYEQHMVELSTNKTILKQIAKDTILANLKTHCAFSQASGVDQRTHYHNSILNYQDTNAPNGDYSFQTAGIFPFQFDHPFSMCDNTDMNYLLRHKDVFGIPYLLSQLVPSSRMWITYRTIQYLFDKTDQENKLGQFNTYFWSYAETVKRLELDLQYVIGDSNLQDEIQPEDYFAAIKQTLQFPNSVGLKQFNDMNRYTNSSNSNDEIEEKIQNITKDEFKKMFELNKKMLKTMKVQVSNNELAITAFLQLINTGPVFNSLILAKYIPNLLSEPQNVIFSWKKINDENNNWDMFKNTVQKDYDTTFYTLSGGAVVTVLGLCACNALGLAVMGTVFTAAGYMGLAWKKEAEQYKLLKVMILSIGWHTPTVAYITYQVLVLTTIVIKLCNAVSDAEQARLRYEELFHDKTREIAELEILINTQQEHIYVLTRSENYVTYLAYNNNTDHNHYEQNCKSLQEMSNKLEDNREKHRALLREIDEYNICKKSTNSQKQCILKTIDSLKRNIHELTACQKLMSAVSVISILNDVAYTLFYTVEKMDGEWNFMSHQIGMLYSHIGSEKKRPIAATHLLTPFDSVFHTVSRCVNEQIVHFFCSNSVQSEYITEIYMNISSATLASVYFLAGPSSSLLAIIRFLRSHVDIYYSKGKINNIQNTLNKVSNANLHEKEITQKTIEKNLEIERMKTQRRFYQKSGMIWDKGIHPEFIEFPVRIMFCTEENNKLLDAAVNQATRNIQLQLMNEDEEY